MKQRSRRRNLPATRPQAPAGPPRPSGAVASPEVLPRVPAPLWRRMPAFLIDFLAAALLGLPPLVLLDFVAPKLSDATSNFIARVTGFILFVGYSSLITISRGQTLGKFIARLRIVDARTGLTPADGQVVKRFLVLGLSLFVFGVVLPLFPIPPWVILVGAPVALLGPLLVRSDHRAFHDLAAGTMVVPALADPVPRSPQP